jgi:hypothetical protein
MSALTVSVVVATWLVSVPALIGASSLFAFLVLLTALGRLVLHT